MGIQALLIDKSEIIGKMLSHCLHHYLVKVSRFDSWEEGKAKFSNSLPDIVFVDWEIGKGALAFSLKEMLPSSPVVPLFRPSGAASSTSSPPPSESFPYQLTKPLNPQAVRDTVSALVPKLKEFKIHSFLKFPKTLSPDLQEAGHHPTAPKALQPDGASSPLVSPPIVSPVISSKVPPTTGPPVVSPTVPPMKEIEEKIAQPADHFIPSSGKISIPVDVKKSALESPSAKESLTTRAKKAEKITEDQTGDIKTGDIKTRDIKTGDTKTEETKTGIIKTATKSEGALPKETVLPEAATPSSVQAPLKPPVQAPVQAPPSHPSPHPSSHPSSHPLPGNKGAEDNSLENNTASGESSYGIAVQKEDLDIDENTQNDLAPLPIKSSSAGMDRVAESQMELSERDILRVINKYKDTLEFQNLMEEALKEHTSTVVQKVLQAEASGDILQRSLKGFKGTEEFKKLVEGQIKDFIKTSLPLVVKETVEQEIKKIIGD